MNYPMHTSDLGLSLLEQNKVESDILTRHALGKCLLERLVVRQEIVDVGDLVRLGRRGVDVRRPRTVSAVAVVAWHGVGIRVVEDAGRARLLNHRARYGVRRSRSALHTGVEVVVPGESPRASLIFSTSAAVCTGLKIKMRTGNTMWSSTMKSISE